MSTSMVKDTALYMSAKVIEGILGILTVAIYTYYFIPEEYGRYNIINLTIVTSSMIVVQWLSQSMMRYINQYNNNKYEFYSTAFFIWARVNIICVILSCLGIIVYTFFNSSLLYMLSICIIMFVSYGTALLTLNILVSLRYVKLNLMLSLGASALKLLMLLILIKMLGAKIELILISNIIFDILTSIIVILKLHIFKYISYKNYSKTIYNKFILYGFPLIGLTFSTAILYNSSRYVIKFISGSAAVGIYYANQSLMSSAFSMLSNAVMKGSYPSILKSWNKKDNNNTIELISEAVRIYLILAIPSIAGIWVLAEFISSVLLEPSYVEGYTVMKWIATGMTFLGITEYCNKYWELKADTKTIFIQSLISGVITIFLNIIFVVIFGYKASALATAIGFFIYFIISYISSRKKMKWTLTYLNYVRIIGSAFIMGVVVKILSLKMSKSFITIGLLVIIGILLYIILLYITGEIKKEINFLKNFLKSKCK